MRGSVSTPDQQPMPLRWSWVIVAVMAFALLSLLANRQPSWAQPHQNALRATVNTPEPSPTPGPSATATQPAAPGITRLLLRNGEGDYEGTMDTYIDAYTPRVSRPLDGGLKLKGTEIQSVLIRFDLAGQVPADATILEAELVFYVEIPAGAEPRALDVGILRVLRPWQANVVSWNYLDAGARDPWGAPGCNEPGVDRLAVADDVAIWQYRAVYQGFDVTDSVQHWQQHPDQNLGWLIKGVSASTAAYTMSSSRASGAQQRPLLRIDYASGDTTPTATLTSGPSPTPGPSFTPTRTPSMPTATATPTLTPAPQQRVLVAQADTYLDAWAIHETHGGLGYLRLRANGLRKPVVQFDLASLSSPDSAVEVLSASLELSTGATAPPSPVVVTAHRLLTCWDEATATWNLAATGHPWSSPGASGSADYDATGSQEVWVSQANHTYVWDVTTAVQAMVAEGDCGLVLVGKDGTNAEASLLSSEAGQNPPRLVVRYLSRPLATPTPEGRRLLVTVYQDLNQDGRKQVSEPGLPGTTVDLLDDGTKAQLSRLTTNADGQATFWALGDTFYRVQAHNRWGYHSTTADSVRVLILLGENQALFGDIRGGTIALPMILN